MIIEIGHEDKIIGQLKFENGRLKASGDINKLQHIVSSLKEPNQNISDFLETLPHRLKGYLWAVEI